ncbi:MAG TPA: prolyl oligopeptidase family serine peptidase [Terriglobia bacterium]|nr:prolyl oligopeptidase family serine peptidase [Terriglobia bacterium]
MKRTSRRRFLNESLGLSLGLSAVQGLVPAVSPSSARPKESQAPKNPLPGTRALTVTGDLAAQMVEGIRDYLLQATADYAADRSRFWKPDFTSARAYEESVAPNREHLRKIVGAVDPRVPGPALQIMAASPESAEVARGARFKVYAVRWEVCGAPTADSEPLQGEGLLLEPAGPARARVIAVPDADWTPEAAVGLAPGVPAAAWFPRRLAESGCQVIVPLLIDRGDKWSGIAGVKMTNQPHREWVYRMAFEVGRHIIGFEVQKIFAAVDWFEKQNQSNLLPLGVFGYGEGGLLALYAAALDTRIHAAGVSGYFQSRQGLWKEPIYRDLWGLLREFGDAEIAGLVAPRGLLVEVCASPAVSGPPPAGKDRENAACPNGTITTAPLDNVRQEITRARQVFERLNAGRQLQLAVSGEGQGQPGSTGALKAFLGILGLTPALEPGRQPKEPLQDLRATDDPEPRLRRQFEQMVGFTQGLIRLAPQRRREFWESADLSSTETWKQSTARQRQYLWEEVIGRLPAAALPSDPRTRLIYETGALAGYEVVLDVWPRVFSYGILVLPKDINPGEQRPVVVCQHGLEGRPAEAADPRAPDGYMHHFAVALAEEGFVTFAPQNPYIGGDNFRIIQRLGHPIKLALFSFIIGQHQRILDWLCAQDFVDPQRIAFYGISYGGKTAVRVPPFENRYAVSICTADFNEWVWKTTSVESPYSYMLLPEYDMYEFDLANIVNYAGLARLIAPRPFMVERGHQDPVAPDEWVAYEYARVRRFYAGMGLPQNTAIEWWNGPHAIHGVGTFEFLRRHLRWPGRGQQEA